MASPFGIVIHGPLASLTLTNDLGQGKFRVEPPSVHPLFSEYYIQATENLGVVWIKANAPGTPNDSFGYAARALTDRVAQQLTTKYGTPTKSDFFISGSIWDEPQYWINGLADGQRFYSYTWDKKKGSDLPDDIATIYVGATAYGGSEGAATIEYVSTKMALAEKEIEDRLADLL